MLRERKPKIYHAYKFLQKYDLKPGQGLNISKKYTPELFVDYPDLRMTVKDVNEETNKIYQNILEFIASPELQDRYIWVDELPQGLENYNMKNDKMYEGRYLILHRNHTDSHDYYMYNRLSSYFTDTERSKGSKSGRVPVYDYYQHFDAKRLVYNRAVKRCEEKVKQTFDSSKGYDKLSLHEKYFEIHEALYEIYGKPNECTTYTVTVPILMYMLFKPKKILDFSSGWGDRAIGASAYFKWLKDSTGEDGLYHGLDPNEELHPKYEMLKELIGDQVSFFMTGAEVFKPTETYDLVFTSPPYCDLEIYSKAESQSCTMYPEYKDWLNKFMFKTLEMCIGCVVDGGHIAINIINYKDGKNMLDDIIDYMKKREQNYKGIIWYAGGISSSRFQPIAIFQVVH